MTFVFTFYFAQKLARTLSLAALQIYVHTYTHAGTNVHAYTYIMTPYDTYTLIKLIILSHVTKACEVIHAAILARKMALRSKKLAQNGIFHQSKTRPMNETHKDMTSIRVEQTYFLNILSVINIHATDKILV